MHEMDSDCFETSLNGFVDFYNIKKHVLQYKILHKLGKIRMY